MVPVDIARMVIQLLRLTAQYEHGYTPCPVCGAIGRVVAHGDSVSGVQVRYHECSGCGCTFKSVGEMPPPKIMPIPCKPQEKVTSLPSKNKVKGRRR